MQDNPTAHPTPTEARRELRLGYAPLVGLVVLVVAFLLLAFTTSGSQPSALDGDAIRFMQQFNARWFDGLMHFVSDIGYRPIAIYIPAAIILLLLVLRQGAAAVGVLLSAMVFLAYEQIKAITSRTRPGLAFNPAEPERVTDASFPSGHVTFATSLYGFCIYLAWTKLECYPLLRWLAIIPCALMILLTGPSRLYLGAHWLSDVLGGHLFGLAWLLAVILIYRAILAQIAKRSQSKVG